MKSELWNSRSVLSTIGAVDTSYLVENGNRPNFYLSKGDNKKSMRSMVHSNNPTRHSTHKSAHKLTSVTRMTTLTKDGQEGSQPMTIRGTKSRQVGKRRSLSYFQQSADIKKLTDTKLISPSVFTRKI